MSTKNAEGEGEGPSTPTTEVVREALTLVHHHPGRLRMRADAFREDAEVGHRVKEATLGVPGVRACEHNLRTGSILVEYEPGHAEPDVILAHVARAAGVEPCAEDALARSRSPALLAVGAVQELNAITSELTGHAADLRSLIPAALAAVSAYAIVTSKEPRLPRWDNLLWWSYSVFVSHHGPEILVSGEERRLERDARASGQAPRPRSARTPRET